jgi:hypothetical protein
MRKSILVLTILLVGTTPYFADAQNSDGQIVYWEQLSDDAKKEIIESDEIDAVAVDYYEKGFKFTDDEKLFTLLDVLTSKPGNRNINALYFYLLNDICAKSDGAVSEVMGCYCLKMMVNAPLFVLNYFTHHETAMSMYASYIGHELYFKEEGVSGIEYDFDSFKKLLSDKIGDDANFKLTLANFNNGIDKAMKEMD